jgi:GH24 family phage-related lysozyme (muramidase)
MSTDIEANWDEVEADFEHFEGKVSHMYLDTVGLVTVGVGKMLRDIAAAQELPFVRRADGAAASPAEIAADFNAVASQAKGKIASTYERYTALDLPDEAIAALLKTVVDGFEADLADAFAGYDSYPLAAKRALLDMIYNLGLAGLLKFKKLKAAVEAGDWQGAAAQCHRNGPSQERNDWTRDQFLAAAP